MDHYYTNPLSVLNCGKDQYNAFNITENHLERVKRLPSFKRFINDEQLPSQVRQSILRDDAALRNFINESMGIFEICHRRYPAAFSCYMAVLQLIQSIRSGPASASSTSAPNSLANKQYRRQEYQKVLADEEFDRRLTELERELEQTASRSLIETLLKRWQCIIPSHLKTILFPHVSPAIDTLLSAASQEDFSEEHRAVLRSNLYFREDEDFTEDASSKTKTPSDKRRK